MAETLRPICVTKLGKSMGSVFQPFKMLGPEGVQAEIKNRVSVTLGGPAPLRRNTSERFINTIAYLGVCPSETLEWEALRGP